MGDILIQGAPNDSSHRVFRYILKIGNLEQAIQVFRDLLGMKIFSHEEFDDGSPDGVEVSYGGRWSRTTVGFGTGTDQVCLQLTFNYKIEKYVRGNHLQAIEIQLADTTQLEEAGLPKEISRGSLLYVLDCNGYRIEVVKSPKGNNSISRIIFNCEDPIRLSGSTIRFWTECLNFQVVTWATDIVHEDDVDSAPNPPLCFRLFCRRCLRRVKRQSILKQLQDGEEPYVELQYGSSSNFILRIQRIPVGVEFNLGTGHERLVLTCKQEDMKIISDNVKSRGKLHGGFESKKSFQLVPGRSDLLGIVASDPNGLQVCFYCDDDLKQLYEIQLDAESVLLQSINEYKRVMHGKRSSGGGAVRFYV